MIRRGFRARPYDDRGTSLVLALVFITVGSLVVMSVLALADTSMRTTIALRNNASEIAAAEGAANVAINTLRDGEYGGTGTCFGGSNTLTLSNFYQRPNGTQDSARVTCDVDPTPTSTTAPIGTPSRALLTLDSTPTASLGGPIGISVTNPQLTGSTGSLRVTGDVHSNSNIVIQPKVIIVPSGNLTSSGAIRANRACSTGTGLFSPNPTCNTGTVVADPAYPMPTVAGLPTRAVPPCGAVMTFQPGRYADFLNLTQRTSLACAGGNGVLHFTPGIYYFDFGAPDLASVPWTWALTRGTVIGGALRSGVTLGPGMPVPNSCVSPVPTGSGWRAPAPTDGVTFVFSGGSQMLVSGAAKVELCGRYAGRSAPLAVTAERATGLLGTLCGTTLWPCAAISTATPTAFVVQGTTYLPTRELVLGLNNSSNQALRGGVVVRRVWANTTRGTGSAAVIETPTDPYTERRTIVYLNVYVCSGSSTCASGQLQLRTKVAIVDPTAIPVAGVRQMTVLSWSQPG
jgi:hypothetical protein